MEIHRLNCIPERPGQYCGYDVCQLADCELTIIEKKHGADEIWYWYGTGDYEGDGDIIMRRGTEWCQGSMGHCSCWGPTDNLPEDWHPSFEAMLESVTASRREELKALIELIEGQ